MRVPAAEVDRVIDIDSQTVKIEDTEVITKAANSHSFLDCLIHFRTLTNILAMTVLTLTLAAHHASN